MYKRQYSTVPTTEIEDQSLDEDFITEEKHEDTKGIVSWVITGLANLFSNKKEYSSVPTTSEEAGGGEAVSGDNESESEDDDGDYQGENDSLMKEEAVGEKKGLSSYARGILSLAMIGTVLYLAGTETPGVFTHKDPAAAAAAAAG